MMNTKLRIEYKDKNNDQGSMANKERMGRYIRWMEDELTKERKVVENLTIPIVSTRYSCSKCCSIINYSSTISDDDGLIVNIEYRCSKCNSVRTMMDINGC